MSLLYSCRQCGHPIDWTNAPPPWCPKCGADFKPGGKAPPPAAKSTAAPVLLQLAPDNEGAFTTAEAREPTSPPVALELAEDRSWVPPPPPPRTEEPPAPRPASFMGAPLWPKGNMVFARKMLSLRINRRGEEQCVGHYWQ